ncbi:HAD family hydrolase [soil metagenome]
MSVHGVALRGLTLDLDDTLWPVWPAIARAEADLHGFLALRAPATAQRFDTAALRAIREQVEREHPEWGLDFTRMRLESVARALAQCGDDPALAVPAFEVFFEGRNRVECFDDALPALEALAARWPIVALTNGNADLARIGISHHFVSVVSAREFGIGKPDPRAFHEACRRVGAAPHEVLHIGDDWALDVVGAHRAGLHSAWVHRDQDDPLPPDADVEPTHVVRDLNQLAARLLG